MSELTIRKATVSDVPGLETIEQECFETPWSEESLRHDIAENKLATYIVADLEGELIGYIGVWSIADEGHINNVAVLPKYRRMHVGTILLNTMINATEEAGIVSHTLEVRASNEAAQSLYGRFGFKESGRRKGYYEDNGEDAIIMWRMGDPDKITEES
ncbi:ribosomal protein S18-alanine N-acetyltransferase [Aminicella lysinilytica]|uniref:[SSU ribosomal protein S18P]-alanine acetyltransferase n=1 Tax=Aminicella lysinilytica TaxID=433323 RepID=A0A4R6Q1D2_9FIRM|nr:ribosomal protein S18-alanine N-acetyltransferase [Aminicella lysinilytica]TDP55988.1 [SSU ribosomal protein S18P]-alanine acetyltransferase [Aminicella lysinilytica]